MPHLLEEKKRSGGGQLKSGKHCEGQNEPESQLSHSTLGETRPTVLRKMAPFLKVSTSCSLKSGNCVVHMRRILCSASRFTSSRMSTASADSLAIKRGRAGYRARLCVFPGGPSMKNRSIGFAIARDSVSYQRHGFPLITTVFSGA